MTTICVTCDTIIDADYDLCTACCDRLLADAYPESPDSFDNFDMPQFDAYERDPYAGQ